MYNKKNGVYYTPSALAEYLAEPLIISNKQSILDPAYGEGSLLLAAEKIYQIKNFTSNINLFGCDTKPLNGLLKHLPEANLKELDFFNYPTDRKFQTVLMNPPYVRHHLLDLEKIKQYRDNHPQLNLVKNKADLWVYFLIKAVSHLEDRGSIGAILPWSFLQADYAKPLRTWLAEIFENIKIVTLSQKYFQDADERVVILWLTGYGKKCTSIQLGSSPSIDTEVNYSPLSLNDWNSEKVFYTGANDIESILLRYKREYGFEEFSNFGNVKIGVVSGAVDYFIMSRNDARELGIKANRLLPILNSADEFANYISNGKKDLDVLLALKRKDHLKYRKFIKLGIEEEYHLRRHSQDREPWYVVKIGKIPDAFFPYRMSIIPYLIPNKDKIQCTNSIHRVYFNNLRLSEKKWLMISMLSAPSQLSLERNSKTYGRGILKIEPGCLKKTIVVVRNDSSVNKTYSEVLRLLSQDKKVEAMNISTEFISSKLQIPSTLITSTKQALRKLQNLRLHKK